MKITIIPRTFNGEVYQNVTVDLPVMCPQCLLSIKPEHLYSYTSNEHTLFSCFLCPVCEQVFLVRYPLNYDHCDSPAYVIPKLGKKEIFPDNIQEVSPMFCQIYNEALEAESRALNTICGMGYRKALEFLIKDFATKTHPEAAEEIACATLGNCIRNYIDNHKIQRLAQASTWIGNDETHYIRRNEEYDVTHMKSFIMAAVSFINSELELLRAEELVGNS